MHTNQSMTLWRSSIWSHIDCLNQLLTGSLDGTLRGMSDGTCRWHVNWIVTGTLMGSAVSLPILLVFHSTVHLPSTHLSSRLSARSLYCCMQLFRTESQRFCGNSLLYWKGSSRICWTSLTGMNLCLSTRSCCFVNLSLRVPSTNGNK